MALSLTLREIVGHLGGEAVGEVTRKLTGVATIDSAGPGQIAFLSNPKYRTRAASTRAGALIVGPGDRDVVTIPRIVTDNPYAYYARIVTLFNPETPATPGIHPTAQVDPEAIVAPSAEISAFVVIGPRARIGDGVRVGAGSFIGVGASVGEGTRIYPRVTLYDGCAVGVRCVLHSGVVIGADGFGMARGEGRWIKIPQVGRAIVGDDVEIGANTCVDRGALDDTVIEEGVKLDNLIQVGHNVRIGAHTVIAGCTGIAGSVTIGKHCMIGGAVSIVGHTTICDHVSISATSLISKSITKPGTYTSSMPFMPHADWLRNAVHLRRLDEMAKRIPRKRTGGDLERNDD
jgi:UDP-3-O-[3-hydroxymyristoyl] glucosamine N-acyltransferase